MSSASTVSSTFSMLTSTQSAETSTLNQSHCSLSSRQPIPNCRLTSWPKSWWLSSTGLSSLTKSSIIKRAMEVSSYLSTRLTTKLSSLMAAWSLRKTKSSSCPRSLSNPPNWAISRWPLSGWLRSRKASKQEKSHSLTKIWILNLRLWQ